MAAPNSAYRTISLYARKAGANIQHRRAIIQTSLAVMKTRFYLDDAFISKDSDGNDGLVGVCFPGTTNYIMHADAHFGSLRKGLNGQTFNDGGLNTLGIASNIQITNLVAGSIAFSGDFKSAFYVLSDDRGFEYTLKGGAANFARKGAMAENTQATLTHTLNPLTLIKAGDVITLKGFVENAEGTYTTIAISGTVQPFQTSAMYTTGWPSTASNPVTIWAKESFAFQMFYTNAAMTNLAPDGYYVFAGKWFQVGTIPGDTIKGVIAQGEAIAGGWPDGDPANPTIQTKDWYGYSNVSRQAALDNSTATKIGTMYRNPTGGLWYTNYNSGTGIFTGLVPTGFYAAELGSGLTWGFENGALKPPNWNG